jgi:hypothetical protein
MREAMLRPMRMATVSGTGRAWRISGCVLAALVWAAVPRTAEAQAPPTDVARARELFVQATELRDQGDLRRALEKFEAAHALANNPITTFEVARTYAALGMLVEARDAYASIARLPVQADEAERATLARRDGAKAAEDLRSRVPTLSIKVAIPLSVTLDDRAVPAAALEAPRAVNPGTHHLVGTGAGGVRAEQTIIVGEGEAREVELAVAPAPPAAHEREAGAPPQLAPSTPSLADASRQAPEGGGNHFGPFAYAGFGVGAAGFLSGSILAAATLSKASSISTHCTSAACEQSGTDAAHSARDLGIAAVVSYTLAAVGVGVGVADLLLYRQAPTASGRSVHPWIGVGVAGLRGSF